MTIPSHDQQEKLLSKLPDLRIKDQRVMLQKSMLKELSDTEFSILWYMPHLDVVVTPQAKKYIETRRRKLKLKFKGNAGYDLKNEENG